MDLSFQKKVILLFPKLYFILENQPGCMREEYYENMPRPTLWSGFFYFAQKNLLTFTTTTHPALFILSTLSLKSSRVNGKFPFRPNRTDFKRNITFLRIFFHPILSKDICVNENIE